MIRHNMSWKGATFRTNFVLNLNTKVMGQVKDMIVFLLVSFSIIKGVGLFMDHIFIPIMKYTLTIKYFILV